MCRRRALPIYCPGTHANAYTNVYTNAYTDAHANAYGNAYTRTHVYIGARISPGTRDKGGGHIDPAARGG